jgi:hypothetical protein
MQKGRRARPKWRNAAMIETQDAAAAMGWNWSGIGVKSGGERGRRGWRGGGCGLSWDLSEGLHHEEGGEGGVRAGERGR